tara:strand:+ start:2965 stop:3513 length:549 start_codon:yes stop_codon:yes gene_type:complete
MTLWYVGDPCYAINDDTWSDFCDILTKHSNDALEREGIEFDWEERRVYVYNSGLGGDGSITLGEHRLCVDAGLLSVLPLEVCERLPDEQKTEGEHGCHSIINSYHRPVFDISTNEFPNVTLEYTTFVDGVGTRRHTLNDTTGHSECDVCGEWESDNNMCYSDHQGAACHRCYEEDEDEDEEE